MALATLPIPPDTKRDLKARANLDRVARWPRGVLKVAVGAFPAGTEFRRAPSSRDPRVTYKVTPVFCECPDYAKAGNICWHVRAVVLHEQRQQRTAQPARPRLNVADVFPICRVDGCDGDDERLGYCYRHRDARCAEDRCREPRTDQSPFCCAHDPLTDAF